MVKQNTYLSDKIIKGVIENKFGAVKKIILRAHYNERNF